MRCPRCSGVLRWDGEDTVCITCGYVHYPPEEQAKLRYQLWLDEIRRDSGRRPLTERWRDRRKPLEEVAE